MKRNKNIFFAVWTVLVLGLFSFQTASAAVKLSPDATVSQGLTITYLDNIGSEADYRVQVLEDGKDVTSDYEFTWGYKSGSNVYITIVNPESKTSPVRVKAKKVNDVDHLAVVTATVKKKGATAAIITDQDVYAIKVTANGDNTLASLTVVDSINNYDDSVRVFEKGVTLFHEGKSTAGFDPAVLSYDVIAGHLTDSIAFDLALNFPGVLKNGVVDIYGSRISIDGFGKDTILRTLPAAALRSSLGDQAEPVTLDAVENLIKEADTTLVSLWNYVVAVRPMLQTLHGYAARVADPVPTAEIITGKVLAWTATDGAFKTKLDSVQAISDNLKELIASAQAAGVDPLSRGSVLSLVRDFHYAYWGFIEYVYTKSYTFGDYSPRNGDWVAKDTVLTVLWDQTVTPPVTYRFAFITQELGASFGNNSAGFTDAGDFFKRNDSCFFFYNATIKAAAPTSLDTESDFIKNVVKGPNSSSQVQVEKDIDRVYLRVEFIDNNESNVYWGYLTLDTVNGGPLFSTFAATDLVINKDPGPIPSGALSENVVASYDAFRDVAEDLTDVLTAAGIEGASATDPVTLMKKVVSTVAPASGESELFDKNKSTVAILMEEKGYGLPADKAALNSDPDVDDSGYFPLAEGGKYRFVLKIPNESDGKTFADKAFTLNVRADNGIPKAYSFNVKKQKDITLRSIDVYLDGKKQGKIEPFYGDSVFEYRYPVSKADYSRVSFQGNFEGNPDNALDNISWGATTNLKGQVVLATSDNLGGYLEYTITKSVKSSEAVLDDILVGNGELSPAFSADVFDYNVEAYRSAAQVTIAAIQGNTKLVKPSKYNDYIQTVPLGGVEDGTEIYTLHIASEDSTRENIYHLTLVYVDDPESPVDLTLRGITINDREIEGFTPEVTAYAVQLPAGEPLIGVKVGYRVNSAESWAVNEIVYSEDRALVTITVKSDETDKTNLYVVTVTPAPTAIQAVSTVKARVSSVSGALNITSPAEKVSIYTVSGKLIKTLDKVSGSVQVTNLPGGVLVVKGSSGWVKKAVI